MDLLLRTSANNRLPGPARHSCDVRVKHHAPDADNLRLVKADFSPPPASPSPRVSICVLCSQLTHGYFYQCLVPTTTVLGPPAPSPPHLRGLSLADRRRPRRRPRPPLPRVLPGPRGVISAQTTRGHGVPPGPATVTLLMLLDYRPRKRTSGRTYPADLRRNSGPTHLTSHGAAEPRRL